MALLSAGCRMNQALSIFRDQKAMASTHTLPPSSSSFGEFQGPTWRQIHILFIFCQHRRHRRTCSLPSSAVTHWQKPDSRLPAVFISISSDSPLPDHRRVAPSRSWVQPPGSLRRLSPGGLRLSPDGNILHPFPKPDV